MIDEQALLDQIEQHGPLVDAGLDRAARWRGGLRKPSPGDRRRRLGRSFDGLVTRARRGDLEPMTPDQLCALNGAIGLAGRFRAKGATLGDYVFPHSVRSIHGAVETALERAADGAEPAPLASVRLHLELLLIHPFADGNGRTARLAATWVLLRAGYRSTLLTAVEQHVLVDPHRYIRGFNNIVLGGLDTQWPFLRALLGLMAGASEHAAWFAEREDQMRGALHGDERPDRVLIAHDFEGADIPALRDFERLSEMRLPALARSQIRRLLEERRGDPIPLLRG